MTYLKECKRCGQCCKWIAVKSVGLSPENIEWLEARGAIFDGDYLIIEHWCPHLSYEGEIASCDIHFKDNYPIVCRRYRGRGRYYIPQGCIYFDPEEEAKQKRIVEDEIAKQYAVTRQRKNKQSKKETKKDLEVSRVEKGGA